MQVHWIALALVLSSKTATQPQFGLSDVDYVAGWRSMSDEQSRDSWDLAVNDWRFEGPLLKRAAKATKYLSWKVAQKQFELEFEWRENPTAETAWETGRIVLRPDNSALALLGPLRLDRAAKSDLPSFCAGPFELTPAPSEPGWNIALRPGETELELRNMKLRLPENLLHNSELAQVFDVKALAGSRALGDARFSIQDGAIEGEVGGGSQSFLCSERSFGDFVLDVDVKNEQPGNSGIQVRSHENDQKRLFGYQIEIDPSPRAWSGGLYDEARRGWLDDLSNNPLGRAAFKNGEWNHYRIQCIGPSIRAWVNDVPTANYFDASDFEGRIGLQVHSGKDTQVRWQNFQLQEFGRTHWIDFEKSLKGRSDIVGERGLRLRCQMPRPGSDSEATGSEILTLKAQGWVQVIPLPAMSQIGCEVVIVTVPPQVLLEIDGHRLPAIPWTPLIESKEQAQAQYSVSWEGPWTIESAQCLREERLIIEHGRAR